MIFKNYQWRILIRVALLLITLTGAAFLIAYSQYLYLLFVVPVLILQVIDFFRFHQKAQEEVPHWKCNPYVRALMRSTAPSK